MHLGTKGRYAVMAMTDLAGRQGGSRRNAGRYRRAAGNFAVLSRAAFRASAPPRAGQEHARARRRLSAGQGGRGNQHPRYRACGRRAAARHPLRRLGNHRLHGQGRALPDPRSVGRDGPSGAGLSWPRIAGRCAGRADPASGFGGGVTSIYLDYNATAPVRPEAAKAVAARWRRGAIPRRSMRPAAPRARSSSRRGRRSRSLWAPCRARSPSPAAAPRPMRWPSRARGRRASTRSSSAPENMTPSPKTPRPAACRLRSCRWMRMASPTSAGSGQPGRAMTLVCLMLANNETGCHPTGRRGFEDRARGRWLAARRCGAGGGQDRHRFHRAGRRHPGAVGSQAGRTAGDRGAGRRAARHAGAASARRRAGTRPPGGHRECAGYRRFRRGC